jgi:hypothetical protein
MCMAGTHARGTVCYNRATSSTTVSCEERLVLTLMGVGFASSCGALGTARPTYQGVALGNPSTLVTSASVVSPA